jgi:TRAP-type C4-dicarboxylate transport system substrate-binding protein
MTPRDMPVALGFEVWGKEVEKRTNGRVKCEFYWSQALVKAGDELKATGAGIADVAIETPSYHPSETPFVTIGELGFVTRSPDAVARALMDLLTKFPAFKGQYDRHNTKVVSFVPFPPNIFGSTKPIKTLEDLKGKKIRALGLLNEVFSKLGATPVAIPAPEIYEALSRGVIEGYTGFPLNAVKGFKLHEVAKYYVDFGYGNYLVQEIIFNKDKFNSLPPDIQKIVEEVNGETIGLYMDVYAKEEQHYVTPLKEAGCNFYTFPASESDRLKNLAGPSMWSGWVEKNKKYGPSQEFFDRFMELVKKYEPSSKYVNPFPR